MIDIPYINAQGLESRATKKFKRVMAYLQEHKLDGGRKGGNMRLFVFNPKKGNTDEPAQIDAFPLGVMPLRDRWRYEMNSAEKAARLANCWRMGNRYCSSWCTRNPDMPLPSIKQWGGAIVVTLPPGIVGPKKRFAILSFSGLPEDADEVLCLLVAQAMGWEVETKTVLLSGNKLARAFFDLVLS